MTKTLIGTMLILFLIIGCQTSPPCNTSATQENKDNNVYDKSVENKYSLIEKYLNGEVQKQDIEEILEWLRNTAEQGNAEAQYQLGHLHSYEGAEQDSEQAAHWFQEAANQGHADAYFYLGLLYEGGMGVEHNVKKAITCWKQGASYGSARAQYKIAGIYEDQFGYNEYGVKQDYAEAAKWYRKAAEKGHDGAQFCMGVIYKRGRGVKQDYSQAVKWFKKAVDQEYVAAYYSLGTMYLYGYGVKQDREEALRWIEKGAENGDFNARKAMKGLKAK